MEKGEYKDTFDAVRAGVVEFLGGDDSGHGMDHIDRVEAMTMRFCEHFKGEVDANIARLAALLHDVDDYKLVGHEKAAKLANATSIMAETGVGEVTSERVKEIIQTMGYRNALNGIRPSSIEGMIVSDADMCDGMGVSGSFRSVIYAVSSKGSGVVFDKDMWPLENMTASQYNANGTTHDTDSAINYFFEKLLKLKDMMITDMGKREAEERDAIMIELLRHYFREQNTPEWSDFLEEYLAKR